MKLHTPDGNELMEVQRIEREGDHLVVRGTIMGTMPTKAVIRPENLRAALKLLFLGLLLDIERFYLCGPFMNPGGGVMGGGDSRDGRSRYGPRSGVCNLLNTP